MIAITGAPTQAVEQAGKYVHHSLGEGRFDSYQKMFEHITTAQAYITAENATTEIPRVINAAIHERRPVHIHLPIDVAMTEIEVDSEYDVAPIPDVNVDRYIDMVADKLRSAHNQSLSQVMKSTVSTYTKHLSNLLIKHTFQSLNYH